MTNDITVTANPFGAVVPQQNTLPSTAQTESARAVAEVQAALMIAKMNPRDPRIAMDRILNACTRKSLADTAIYSYARGGSAITGASIRLAEAVAQQWGNMQFGIRELSNTNGKSEVQAFAWDVETNTRREVTFTVPHIRHTKKGSYKLEDPRDIYELVANQGARRLRACILAVIPGDVIEAAVDQCTVTQKLHADVSPEGIAKLLESFKKYDVSRAQIEKFIQRRIEAIEPAQVVRLRNIYRSLVDGMATPADFFEPEEKPVTEKESKPKSLKEKLKARQETESAAESVAEDDLPDVGLDELEEPEM